MYRGRWRCNLCDSDLEITKVRLQYRNAVFPVYLPVCPVCSIVLVEEALATGNMAEAEQILEDK